jgi:hypothetical protein
MATIMHNVFIISGQHGRRGGPSCRASGEMLVHNTYFTLPVVFSAMLLIHATAHAHEYNWLIRIHSAAAGALTGSSRASGSPVAAGRWRGCWPARWLAALRPPRFPRQQQPGTAQARRRHAAVDLRSAAWLAIPPSLP